MRHAIAFSFLAIATAFQGSLIADDQLSDERAAVTTAKERLASKAADPQRLNDCKVPKAKRDPHRPRPDDCAHLKPEAKRAAGAGTSP